jgi:hypothetical protein
VSRTTFDIELRRFSMMPLRPPRRPALPPSLPGSTLVPVSSMVRVRFEDMIERVFGAALSGEAGLAAPME